MQEDKEVITKESPNPSTRKGVFQASYLVYYVLGILETLLLLRLIFKLLGANPGSGFVDWIYSISGILIAPFASIFPIATSEGVAATSVLEPATIVAIIIYALIAWAISALIKTFIIDKE